MKLSNAQRKMSRVLREVSTERIPAAQASPCVHSPQDGSATATALVLGLLPYALSVALLFGLFQPSIWTSHTGTAMANYANIILVVAVALMAMCLTSPVRIRDLGSHFMGSSLFCFAIGGVSHWLSVAMFS